MRKIILVAISDNGCIGVDNSLPWYYPEDLKRFKSQTMGHSIIMGRKTYESMGRPLPGRKNIILTRSNFSHPDLFVCRNLDDAFNSSFLYSHETFVIGGANVYEQCLPLVDEIRVTRVPGSFGIQRLPDDVFFPEWPLSYKWQAVKNERGEESPGLEYITYRRRDDS